MMEYNSHFDGSWSFSWKTVKFGDKSVSFPDSSPYLLLQDRPLSSRPPVAPPRVFTCCHQWHASWYTGDPIPSSWDASRAPTFKIIHSNVPYQDISSYTKINQDISRISDSISHSISPSSQSKKLICFSFHRYHPWFWHPCSCCESLPERTLPRRFNLETVSETLLTSGDQRWPQTPVTLAAWCHHCDLKWSYWNPRIVYKHPARLNNKKIPPPWPPRWSYWSL